jgi:hypothetical protein
MKLPVAAILIILSVGSLAKADELSHKAAAEELLSITKTDQMIRPLFAQMQTMMEQQFVRMGISQDHQPILKRYVERLLGG